MPALKCLCFGQIAQEVQSLTPIHVSFEGFRKTGNPGSQITAGARNRDIAAKLFVAQGTVNETLSTPWQNLSANDARSRGSPSAVAPCNCSVRWIIRLVFTGEHGR